MDPITAMFLVACLLTYGAKKVVGDSIVDNNYAKQGLVSPRFEAQHGREAAAKSGKYGFTDFLRDNWRDYWSKSADAKIAAREVKPREPGVKVSWRDRWGAAKTTLASAADKTNAAVKKVVDPVEVKKPSPLADPSPITDPTVTDGGETPDGTIRFTDTGREQYDVDTDTWQPVPDEPAESMVDEHQPKHAQPEPAAAPTGGTTMTAPAQTSADSSTPTGEAVGVTGGAGQARQIRLAAIALREQTVARTQALSKALETLEASGAEMDIDAGTMGEIARAREAIASLEAAMTGAAEEVTASMTDVEKGFNKHLPGVEFNASVGGMAKRGAYTGN